MKRLFKNLLGIRRRGSALVTVIVLTSLIFFAIVSLSAYALHRRMDAVRLTLHSVELAAAENALERSYALLFFASQRRPAQIRLSRNSNPIESFVAVVVEGLGVELESEGFDIEVVAIPIPVEGADANNVVKITSNHVDEFGIELAPWTDFDMQISGWQVMAGARARNVRDVDGNSAFPFQNFLQRPGVYAAKNLVQYSVPLLNYAIFYENEFELDAGVRIDVRGKVHTNSDWYLTTSDSAYYHDYLTVAGNMYAGIYHPGDHARRAWSGGATMNTKIYIADRALGGEEVPGAQLHNSNRTYNRGWLSSVLYHNVGTGNPKPKADWTPNPEWKDQVAGVGSLFNGYLKDSSSDGIRRVQLPINEQDSPHLLIEAPLPAVGNDANPADMANDGKLNVNLAYKAGLIIETKPGFVGATAADWKNFVEAYRWVDDGKNEDGTPRMRKEYVSLEYERIKPGSTPPVKEVISIVDRVTIYNGREEKNVTMLDFKADRYAEFLKLATDYSDPNHEQHPNVHHDAGLGIPLPKSGTPGGEDGIVYFNVSQEGLSSNQQAAARLSNALFSSLDQIVTYSQRADNKFGLTFATNAPMYTLGHLNHDADNANNRIPLMIAGDAINILSSVFKDSDYATAGSPNGPNPTGNAYKAAAHTTTNAVFVSGNVPSRQGQYSGGGENFYRYLEGWGTNAHHIFRGSMLNLYESRVATVSWDKNPGSEVSSGYYSAPRRDWRWDTRFAEAANVPPGIPTSYNVTKGRWQMVTPGYFQEHGGSEELARNQRD